MRRPNVRPFAFAASLFLAGFAAAPGMAGSATPPAGDGAMCQGYGPQTPRDIRSLTGKNPVTFAMAPAASDMNLCNVHTHTNAEHAGPGFSINAGRRVQGGFLCDSTADLTAADMAHFDGDMAFGGVMPGDTIEVHWVYSSCDITPGKGLGACLSESCANPQLRVETQVFLVVNDPTALDFRDFDYPGTAVGGQHQPSALPTGTGDPVVFLGSTTGPSYSQSICSPLHVTWSVRPNCARLDIASLHAWAADGNIFEEDHSHGVRKLVTLPALLSQIN